ncbi:MAG: hypothetical protein WBO46_25190, partial [Caldilineaceae bacterium]
MMGRQEEGMAGGQAGAGNDQRRLSRSRFRKQRSVSSRIETLLRYSGRSGIDGVKPSRNLTDFTPSAPDRGKKDLIETALRAL